LKYFAFGFFDLSLYFDQAYFIEEKFFCQIQDVVCWPRWRLELKESILAAIFDFSKKKIHKIWVLLTPNKRKKRWKKYWKLWSYAKKSDSDPPFLIEPPFLTHLIKYVLEQYC
jgi:hypothetical protein